MQSFWPLSPWCFHTKLCLHIVPYPVFGNGELSSRGAYSGKQVELRTARTFHVALLLPPMAGTSGWVSREIVCAQQPAAGTKSAIRLTCVYISCCCEWNSRRHPAYRLLFLCGFTRSGSQSGQETAVCLSGFPKKKISSVRSLSITNEGVMGRNDSTHVLQLPADTSFTCWNRRNETQSVDISVARRRYPSAEAAHHSGKAKGASRLSLNITLRNTLVLHEGRQAGNKERHTVYRRKKPRSIVILRKTITGWRPTPASNLSDSRLFGFVPHDHPIGKSPLIWFSKEQKSGPFSGYRWNRSRGRSDEAALNGR